MGSLQGVVRTRVGYAGGTSKDPTYQSIGDHAETIQIDFDPAKISYEQLLSQFWNAHNPCRKKWNRQYMSAIFFSNEQQKKLALETMARVQSERGSKVETEIAPLTRFYIAEDYHQKYRLRQDDFLMAEFKAMYPDEKDFVNSTAAARVNSYLDGNGKRADLQREIASYGLSERAMQKLLKYAPAN